MRVGDYKVDDDVRNRSHDARWQPRSAGWQPAVSQAGSLRSVRCNWKRSALRRPADCQSAIQQTASLRYEWGGRMSEAATNSNSPRHPRRLTVDDYVAGVLAGDRAILARAITLVESNSRLHEAQAQEVLNRLLPHTGKAKRVGITGVPGVGKSTFIETFGCYLVEQGHKLAVLTIDPTSARSGGSILGDKTRMEKLCVAPNAFIRPSPSGDNLGGVARRTRETMLLCEAAGFDTIIVESVGVGAERNHPALDGGYFCAAAVARGGR
jgi:Ni2+-binding GTPase involved in maturation of urease and hydrogenase